MINLPYSGFHPDPLLNPNGPLLMALIRALTQAGGYPMRLMGAPVQSQIQMQHDPRMQQRSMPQLYDPRWPQQQPSLDLDFLYNRMFLPQMANPQGQVTKL